MTASRISVGDTVRITGGRNQGLEGTVLNVYPPSLSHDSRAFVEIQLIDGPHRTTLALRILERVQS